MLMYACMYIHMNYLPRGLRVQSARSQGCTAAKALIFAAPKRKGCDGRTPCQLPTTRAT